MILFILDVIGDILPYALILICFFLYSLEWKPFYLFLTVLVMLEILFLNPLYKIIFTVLGFDSPRPNNNKSNGMPSGHVSTLVCLSIVLMAYRRQKLAVYLSLVAIVLVAWQRVYSFHHTKTQVIGGAIQGTLDAICVLFLLRNVVLC